MKHDGLRLGVSVQFDLTQTLALAPSIEYATYGFDRYEFQGARIQEIKTKSSWGERSQSFSFFVNGKVFYRLNVAARMYFSMGLGIVTETLGHIDETVTYIGGPNEIVIPVDLPDETYLAHLVGLGIQIEIHERLGMDISGRFHTEYENHFNTSVMLGITYAFNERASYAQ